MKKIIFIVGVESQLGSALFSYLKEKNITVYASTRRKSSAKNNSFIDLNSPSKEWEIPDQITDAVFFSSLTNQKYCETNPDESDFINVEQTRLLISQFGNLNCNIIFPSSNLVLPCVTPNQNANLLKNPMSQYALQKAKIEDFLIESNYKYKIVRLPKVLNSNAGIIAEWRESFSIGAEVFPFHDLMISPISIQYCTKVLFNLLFSKEIGIYQLTGSKEISYEDLLREISKKLGKLNTIKITPRSVRNPKYIDVIRPIHPSLDGSRIEKEFQLPPQTVSELIDDLSL